MKGFAQLFQLQSRRKPSATLLDRNNLLAPPPPPASLPPVPNNVGRITITFIDFWECNLNIEWWVQGDIFQNVR